VLRSETRLDSKRNATRLLRGKAAVTHPVDGGGGRPHSGSSPLPPVVDLPWQNNAISTPATIANELTLRNGSCSPDPRGGKCRRVQPKREIAMSNWGTEGEERGGVTCREGAPAAVCPRRRGAGRRRLPCVSGWAPNGAATELQMQMAAMYRA
jgi:hypothetical protein